MDYNEVAVSTTTIASDLISNILIQNGSKGVSIEDPADLFVKNTPYDWDYAEKTTLKFDHEDVVIRGYYSLTENFEEIIENIQSDLDKIKNLEFDLGTLEISIKEVKQSNWENEWKKYLKITRLSDKIVIKPEWETYLAKDGEIVLELDPGLAFGTGTHETTKMCLLALEKYLKKDDDVIDIGTGSGILSIASVKLGAKNVIATDIDKLAIKVSTENAQKNEVLDKIQVRYGDLTEIIHEKADIVVANIMADIVAELSKDVTNIMKDNALFISSGIIDEKVDFVKENLEKNGLELIDGYNEKHWHCLIAKKRAK